MAEKFIYSGVLPTTREADVMTSEASAAISTGQAVTRALGDGQNGVDHMAGVGLRLALHSHGYNELPITGTAVHVYHNRLTKVPDIRNVRLHEADIEFWPVVANGVKVLAFGDCVRILAANISHGKASLSQFADLANIHANLGKGRIDKILATSAFAGGINAEGLKVALNQAPQMFSSDYMKKHLEELSGNLNLFYALSRAAGAVAKARKSQADFAEAERVAAAKNAGKKSIWRSALSINDKAGIPDLVKAAETKETAERDKISALGNLKAAMESAVGNPRSFPDTLDIGAPLPEDKGRQFQRSDQEMAYQMLVREIVLPRLRPHRPPVPPYRPPATPSANTAGAARIGERTGSVAGVASMHSEPSHPITAPQTASTARPSASSQPSRSTRASSSRR